MSTAAPYRVGEWLPSDENVLKDWLDDLIAKVELRADAPWDPVIQEFADLIEQDPEVYMLFAAMLDQVPYKKTPTDDPQVTSVKQMLGLFNYILTSAPEYNETGLVGFPINAILDWAMGTHAGYAAFLNDKVNAQFKKMLNKWAVYLASPESTYVLNQDPRTGWLGKSALDKMKNFVEDYKCDPSKEHFGFTSWDDFFTRQFNDNRRPVDDPDDDAVIVNACESAPYRLDLFPRLHDRFWLKGQPYSVAHILGHDEAAEQFAGGTVYQAFLSAMSYHRWHSPVNGTIVKTRVIDGTYYSETPEEGFDPAGPNESQGYITEVATRALVFIQADDPGIGLMCFVAVGMAEVSTCEVTVKAGERVKKGQQLGMFHFGGSTHCLLFRKGVGLMFDLHGQIPGLDANNIPINKKIARVCSGA